MLQIRGLNYSIGDRQLMKDIDWVIQPGKRVALIGPNGAGKTTLLKVLVEEIETPKNTLVKPRDYRIGYLPQEEITLGGGSVTILESVLEGQKDVKALEQKIEELHQALEKAETEAKQQSLLKQLGTLEDRYHVMDGYNLEAIAKNILTGLGFKKRDFSRPLHEFSGGWRMRSYLALLLVQEPDLLLLDEPTNHLDIPSLEWLEQYLLAFQGSVVVVSHDRYFIDRVSQEILELENGELTSYPGNYHFYEKQKEQRQMLIEKKWREQQEEIARQERFINRFRAKNTKMTQVQSRIKQLEKLEKIELTPPPPRLEFDLEVSIRSYKEVLYLEDMWFRYQTDWVLQNINMALYRGERAALIGPNGAGKTTLTRLICEQLHPKQGTLKKGERVLTGYYAQHQAETLNLEATILEEVSSTAATNYLTEIRTVLGIFQFSGDEVDKRIKVLSGGEKARVSLAKMLLSPVNFLVMDEPTNHLDKTAREALEHALEKYDGTVLLISHDRYFLDKLVNRVFELKDGKLEEYTGNYSYYLQKRQKKTEQAVSSQTSLPNNTQAGNDQSTAKVNGTTANDQTGKDGVAIRGGKKTKEQKRLEAEARQAISKELNQAKKALETVENRISQLENRIKEIEEAMAQPETYEDKELAVSLQREHAAAKKELEERNPEWEERLLELEEIKANLPQ